MRATGERDERVEITWMRVLVAYVYKSPPLFGGPQSYIISFCTPHTAFIIICKRGLRPHLPYHLTRGAVCGTSGCFFSLPRYLRRCVTLNNTLIIVVYQSIRAHLPTKLSREPALRGSRARATAAARPWAVAHGSQRGQDRSLATHGPPTDERSTRATGARQQSRRSSDRHGAPLRGGARISTRPGPFPRDAWAADGRTFDERTRARGPRLLLARRIAGRRSKRPPTASDTR